MMPCVACRLIGQFLLNFLNLADHTLNFLLLGDADETLSARTSRARKAGQKWASHACVVLTFFAKLATFGKAGDHCDYALDKSVRPNSREIWNWSLNTINVIPISEVIVIDDGSLSSAHKMVLIRPKNQSDLELIKHMESFNVSY